MAEFHHPQQRPQFPHQKLQESHPVVRAVATATVGGSLMVLSGLTLVGTVIALTVATPLLVIFSPILVPAGITVFLVVAGFLTSGGLGVAALSVLSWMYKYLTEKHPPEEDQLDDARKRLAAKAREMKETSQKGVEQQATQSHC